MNPFFLGQLLAQTETTAPRQWRILWNWHWPLWATALAVAIAILWVMSIYFRETSSATRRVRTLLSTLRLVALSLALLMFAQPTLEWFRLARPRLVLLVDRSTSMETHDHDPTTATDLSRIQTWKNLLTAGEQPLVEQWQSTYQLDVLAFDQQIEHLTDRKTPLTDQLRSLQPSKKAPAATRLGDAVDYALRELPGPPPAALLLFTDGIATSGQTLEQAAQRARRLRIPLYTIAIGSERRPPDMSIENLLVEEIVFPGDRLQVEATLRATGFADQPAEVILRDQTSNRILARTTVKLPEDETTKTVRLAIRPTEPGNLHLECTLKPLAADAPPKNNPEANLENNTARQTIEVRNEKIRVLLVQSQPSYEYRALKSLLERDPAVQLHVRLQESDADYHTIDAIALPAFPTSEQQLFSYDVLLLADADFGLLPRTVWPLVERFVTHHGGGLVCIAGPQFMPHAYRGVRSLERLLPIEFDSLNPLRSQSNAAKTFTVQPTSLGWQTPSLQLGETHAESQAIWQSLPPLAWRFNPQNVKPGAQIIADTTNDQGQRIPLILRHYVGAGEVLFHATDETWRWRWRSDDRYFARYWGQVVRRLGRGRLAAGRNGIQLTADRALYQPGEPVQLQARFRNPAQAAEDQIVAQLQNAIDPPRQITLHRHLAHRGLFSASLEDLPPGEYQTQLVLPNPQDSQPLGTAAIARFTIQQPPRELARVAVDRQALLQAAEISGGKTYTLANVSQLSADLPPPRQQPLDRLPPRPLWKSHLLLALFVVTLTTEWLLRRRHGML